MEKKIKQYIKALLVALVPLAFASCELDGPLSHFEIVVNERLTYLPPETLKELTVVNSDFKANPCEKEYAVACFDKLCNDLQRYYDENQGKLIWSDLSFDIALYNKTNYQGTGEGLLVKNRVITYSNEQ